jgi:biotin transport system permease protein
MLMAAGIGPLAYRAGKSPLHRCPAGLKLLFLLALSVSAFSSLPGLAAAAVLVLGLSLWARISLPSLLRGSRPLVFLALFIILVRSFGFAPPWFYPAGFLDGLRQGCCIVVSFAASSLLFAVTTMGELRDSLGRLELWLFRGRKNQKVPRISLGISLMLGFIPRFFEIWETANDAWKARAGGRGPGRIFAILPLACERMLEIASETAQALEARGFMRE